MSVSGHTGLYKLEQQGSNLKQDQISHKGRLHWHTQGTEKQQQKTKKQVIKILQHTLSSSSKCATHKPRILKVEIEHVWPASGFVCTPTCFEAFFCWQKLFIKDRLQLKMALKMSTIKLKRKQTELM